MKVLLHVVFLMIAIPITVVAGDQAPTSEQKGEVARLLSPHHRPTRPETPPYTPFTTTVIQCFGNPQEKEYATSFFARLSATQQAELHSRAFDLAKRRAQHERIALGASPGEALADMQQPIADIIATLFSSFKQQEEQQEQRHQQALEKRDKGCCTCSAVKFIFKQQ